MTNKKRILIISAIIVFVMVLVGGTFAFLTFGNAIVLRNPIHKTSCFIIDYDYTNDDGTMDLGGTLMQTSGPKTGISGKIEMGISDNCTGTVGEGTIYLNVTSADSPLLQSVSDHCENPNTLQTMKNYTSNNDCTSAGYTWVTGKPALKYAVYQQLDSNPVSVGYINKTGDITLYDGFTIYGSKIPYYVYIWLDGELANNSYMGVNFSGNIHLEAEQIDGLPGEAYAVYSDTDKSLRFYRSTTPITVGSTYEGRAVTKVYTGFETDSYISSAIPWGEVSANIKHVVVEDIISPVSTANWFIDFISCSYFDVTKLDTSRVTDMNNMFADMNVSSVLIGEENWNTSNVTNMSSMFGMTIFDNLNISNWDVSSVIDMRTMFYGAYQSQTLDLSGWNSMRVRENEMFSENAPNIVEPDWYTSYAVYSSTDRSLRFYRSATPITAGSTYYGRVVTNVYTGFEDVKYTSDSSVPWTSVKTSIASVAFVNEIIPISTRNWFYNFTALKEVDFAKLNTSNVTSMNQMFFRCSSLTSLNLSGWDTSSVINMTYMFYDCRRLTSLDISGWDTSKVTSMSSMFQNCSSLTSLDLRGWDVSSVTNMSNMFSSCSRLTSLDLRGWDVSSVTSHGGFNVGAPGVIPPNFE